MAGKGKAKFDQKAAFKSIIGIKDESPAEQENTAKENLSDRGRPKERRETKKRISLTILPSIYKNMQKISYIERKSMSEIVSVFFEQYVKDNISKIEEYDRIKKN